MLFIDKKRFGIVAGDFLNSKYIAYSILGSVLTHSGTTPSDGTGIDSVKKMAFIKSYGEQLERKKIGFQVNSSQVVKCVGYFDKEIVNVDMHNFGYGKSLIYGHIDTSGTASGLKSKDIVDNAVLEIIEKNEMLLFWYLKKGCYINKTESLIKMINNIGFSSEQIEVFYSRELTNNHVFIVILISQGKIVASGAGINKDSLKSLKKALLEARLLEWLNKNNPLSTMSKLDEKEQQNTINYIRSLKQDLPHKNFKRTVEKHTVFEEWIKSMDVHVLNKHNNNTSLTIKCISEDLYNCLPLKRNIKDDLNKKIATIYGLDDYVLENTPDCILL